MNWYQVVDADQFFLPGDHAGELETSVMLHLAPELVLPLAEAGPGTARRFRIQGFREKWAWTPRAWTQVTDDTGIGDPHGATAAKGAEFTDLVIAKLAEFLVELAAADVSQLYELACVSQRGDATAARRRHARCSTRNHAEQGSPWAAA
ncbi:MAG: creatininase family protein [Gemmatimonadaceae bacterium]